LPTSQNINVDNHPLELESKIDTILDSYKQIPLKLLYIKNKAPESGFEPESEPRQGVYARSTSKALLAGLCIIVLLAAFGLINIAIEITLSLSYISELAATSQRFMTLTIWRHLRAYQRPLVG
jgi:hypothetical protein